LFCVVIRDQFGRTKNEKEICFNGKAKLCELKYIDDGDGGCCLIAYQRFPNEEQNYENLFL
jgi:hypothetical protein